MVVVTEMVDDNFLSHNLPSHLIYLLEELLKNMEEEDDG